MRKNLSIMLIILTWGILLAPVFGFSNGLVGFGLDSGVNVTIVDIGECDTSANTNINTNIDDKAFVYPLPTLTLFSSDDHNNDKKNDGDSSEEKKVELHKGWAALMNIVPGFGLGTDVQIGNLMLSTFVHEIVWTSIGIDGAIKLWKKPNDYYSKVATITGFSMLGISKLFGVVSPFLAESKPLWYSIMLDVVFGFGAGSAFQGDNLGQRVAYNIYLAGGAIVTMILTPNLLSILLGNTFIIDWYGIQGTAIITIASLALLADKIYSIYRTVEVHNDPSKIKKRFFTLFTSWKNNNDNNDNNDNITNKSDKDTKNNQPNNNNSTDSNEDAENTNESSDNGRPVNNEVDEADKDNEVNEVNEVDENHGTDNDPVPQYIPTLGISGNGLVIGFGVSF